MTQDAIKWALERAAQVCDEHEKYFTEKRQNDSAAGAAGLCAIAIRHCIPTLPAEWENRKAAAQVPHTAVDSQESAGMPAAAAPSTESAESKLPITKYETDHFACAAGLLRFSAAMSAKLAKKRSAGRGGWNKPSECSIEILYQLLEEHERKGDHIDVANLRMMIWNREHPNG